MTGSPAIEDADLRKPWAIVSEQSWGNGTPGGGLSGGPEVGRVVPEVTALTPTLYSALED